MCSILIVDDDVYIGNMVDEVLKKEGYDVIRAYSGTEALLVLSSRKPDLILLDLMLPGLCGEDLLPKIENIPVIVVSAKSDINDKVELLMSGASDYITKPFEIRELLARIKVQLRNASSGTNSEMLIFDNIRIDTSSHSVSVEDKQIKLTKTEYAILRQLMLNPNQVLSKSKLLDLISLETSDCMESSLKVHISNLRGKLRDADGKDHIEAVWGIGFKMRME